MPSAAGKSANPGRPRRPRGSINPPDIVTGALDFFRHTPVEQWSIPQLANHLDVGVTSIYWYFRTKRELVQAMTDLALASFYQSMPPLRGTHWEDLLRNFFVDFYQLLAGDHLTCDLIVRQICPPGSDAATGSWPRAEELFAALAADGVPPSRGQHAFFTLSVYTQGFLLVERTGRGAALSARTAPASPSEFEFGFESGVTSIIRGLRPLMRTPAVA